MFLCCLGQISLGLEDMSRAADIRACRGSEAMEFSGGMFVGRDWELDVEWRRPRRAVCYYERGIFPLWAAAVREQVGPYTGRR